MCLCFSLTGSGLLAGGMGQWGTVRGLALSICPRCWKLCRFISESSAVSQLVTKHRPGRIHMALSGNEGGSMTGHRSLEEFEIM